MTLRFGRRAGMIVASLALAALLGQLVPAARAGDTPAPGMGAKRPKICLVLSGGGARGAAHVGVLKVLEEYRVPIDCIAGTSMGALVGGAYASGMNMAEMDQIIGEISTELLFKEKPPRQERSMRLKEDDYGLFFTPEIGVGNGKLHLGKGLVTGVQLETVLRRLTKVKGFHHFDDLPIPYRAVATDLVTGKAVVFSEGELPSVMRASMSVPGAVAPVEYQGMLLVDGMLTSNLPVDVARAMGADIIIAVDVGTPLLTRDELNGILGVTAQMLSILTQQNVDASLASLKPTDILITPELGDYSTSNFNDLPKIAPLGEVAARKLADRLAQLSIPPEEYAALRRQQTVEVASDVRAVDQIQIDGLQSVNPAAVRSVMQTEAGQPIDQQVLDSDMRRIYGMGNFEHVSYHFVDEPGERILVVDAVEKSWGLNSLRFGLGLSSDFKGDAYYNLVASYRKKWLNSLGAEWRTDAQVGNTSALMSEFYQPLRPEGDFFVAPNVELQRSVYNLYQNNQRVAMYQITSSTAGVDLGTVFGHYGELRLGMMRGALSPELNTGPPSLSPGVSSVAQGAFTLKLLFDQMDSARFPRNGWKGGLNVFNSTSALNAGDDYTKWSADGSAAYSFGEHTFSIAGKAGGRIGASELPRYDEFQWGGFLQQSGYPAGALIGQNVEFGRLMYYQRVLKGTVFEGAYAGMSLELGRVGDPLVPGNPDGTLRSSSVFVGADSPLGPVYLGFGRAAEGSNSVYFFLGLPF